MKVYHLVAVLFLFIYNNAYADEFLEKTSACRMEIKILGPDVLNDDENCIWLEDNKSRVYEKCQDCRAELELIKEASNGNFDY